MGSDKDLARSGTAVDVLCFCAAAVFGVVSLWLPQLPAIQTDTTTRLVLVEGAFFLTGTLLGYLRPESAWRWGLGTILLLPVVDGARLFTAPAIEPATLSAIVTVIADRSPGYLVHLLPALFGAFVGAHSAGRRL